MKAFLFSLLLLGASSLPAQEAVSPPDAATARWFVPQEWEHHWESNFTTSHTLMRLPDGSFRLRYAGRRQPPWSNLYFPLGTARWSGPANQGSLRASHHVIPFHDE